MKNDAQKFAKQARKLLLKIDRDKESNPKTLEGAIRSMILKSPDYTQYRDDALNMMYCVLGAGIEWNNQGRLADNSPNNYMNLPPDTYYGPWSDDFGKNESLSKTLKNLPKDIIKKFRQDMEEKEQKQLNKAITTIKEIDKRCKTYRPNRKFWYPISWYACRLCAPVNAQQDFLNGALETAAIISISKIDYEGHHFHEQMHTIEFAKGILPILKERVKYSVE